MCEWREPRHRFNATQAGGSRGRTLWRLCRVFVRERDLELEKTAFPDGLLLAWYTAIPLLKVHHAVRAAHGFREEAERVVASPLLPGIVLAQDPELLAAACLPLLREAVHTQRHVAVVRLASMCFRFIAYRWFVSKWGESVTTRSRRGVALYRVASVVKVRERRLKPGGQVSSTCSAPATSRTVHVTYNNQA